MSQKAIIYFDGNRYVGTSMRSHPPYDRTGRIPVDHLEEIGTGTRPPGRGTNRSRREGPRPERVARINGVSPAVAIATFPGGRVYRREDATLPVALTEAPWVEWLPSN